jgi:hypothetical protein
MQPDVVLMDVHMPRCDAARHGGGQSVTGSYMLGFVLLAAGAVAGLIVLHGFDRPAVSRPTSSVRTGPDRRRPLTARSTLTSAYRSMSPVAGSLTKPRLRSSSRVAGVSVALTERTVITDRRCDGVHSARCRGCDMGNVHGSLAAAAGA